MDWYAEAMLIAYNVKNKYRLPIVLSPLRVIPSSCPHLPDQNSKWPAGFCNSVFRLQEP